jgi:hypothetical protein
MHGLRPPVSRGLAVTTFDKREEGFEKKFAVDENLKFKSIARRNRLFGQWVAEKLGKSGDERDAYAKEVVAAEIDGGEAAVASKIAADLAAKGSAITEADIKAKLDEFLAVAVAQVKAGT